MTSTNLNKKTLSSDKIGRKKFFLLTGAAALGTALATAIPFGKSAAKDSSSKEPLRVIPNPHAVKRTKNKANGK
ncbi:MAG: hypothetical protein K1X85_13250 [Ignavibacteria bacterium]|nr:hypothetical protein [Ignavibacteria bacterium]